MAHAPRVVYTTIDGLVKSATDSSARKPNWQINMQIVDVLNASPKSIHEGLDCIKRRIKEGNPVTQILALMLLNTVINECPMARSRIGTPDYLRTIKKLSINRKTDPGVRSKALEYIQEWGRDYHARRDLYFAATLWKLTQRGVAFPPPRNKEAVKRTAIAKRKEATSGRAVATKKTPITTTTTTPPPTTRTSTSSVPKKIKPEKLRKELDAVENSITLFSQLIAAVDPKKEDIKENDILMQVKTQCEQMHPKMVNLLQNSTIENEELLSRLLHLNDVMTECFNDFKLLQKGIKPGRVATASIPVPFEVDAAFRGGEQAFESSSDDSDEQFLPTYSERRAEEPSTEVPILPGPPKPDNSIIGFSPSAPPIDDAFSQLSLRTTPTTTTTSVAPVKVMDVNTMNDEDFTRFASQGFASTTTTPPSPYFNPFGAGIGTTSTASTTPLPSVIPTTTSHIPGGTVSPYSTYSATSPTITPSGNMFTTAPPTGVGVSYPYTTTTLPNSGDMGISPFGMPGTTTTMPPTTTTTDTYPPPMATSTPFTVASTTPMTSGYSMGSTSTVPITPFSTVSSMSSTPFGTTESIVPTTMPAGSDPSAFSEFNIFALLNPPEEPKKRTPTLNEQRQADTKPIDDLFV